MNAEEETFRVFQGNFKRRSANNKIILLPVKLKQREGDEKNKVFWGAVSRGPDSFPHHKNVIINKFWKQKEKTNKQKQSITSNCKVARHQLYGL